MVACHWTDRISWAATRLLIILELLASHPGQRHLFHLVLSYSPKCLQYDKYSIKSSQLSDCAMPAEDACRFWQVILSASKTTRFTYILLEEGGDQLDQLYEKLRSTEQSQERKDYPKYNKKKEG